MKRIFAIAMNTHREAIRDRILYGILFFATLILVASLVTEELTIGDQEKVVRGIAQGAVAAFGTLIAVFLGVSLVWKELDRKTIYTIACKPIPRWMFILGKYLGLLTTLAVNLGIMAALYVVLISIQQGFPHPSFWAFVFLLFLRLALLTAWATLFSSYSSPTLATAFTLAVLVIGHLADDIWLFGQQAENPMVRAASSALYWMLPNFELLNVQPQAAHNLAIDPGFIALGAGYALSYTAVVLGAAMLIFQKRDFK